MEFIELRVDALSKKVRKEFGLSQENLVSCHQVLESTDKELDKVKKAAGFCEKHQPTGGTRNCLMCAVESLCAAMGEIALICEDPRDEYKVTAYDCHCDEKQVVEQVRALKKKADALTKAGWGLSGAVKILGMHNPSEGIDMVLEDWKTAATGVVPECEKAR
jgi:hypothetical protein